MVVEKYGLVHQGKAQSDSFKCWSETYQAFEKPLPGGHGSVGLVRYRAVTARERVFKFQQPFWFGVSG